MSVSAKPDDRPWCPFCGGEFKASAKTKHIFYEGRTLKIHKNEYREFTERGVLRYLDSPRSGPFSQDAIDLGLAFLVIATLIVILVIIHPS